MREPAVACIDFETFPIDRRPAYPPEPVGVALKWPGEEPVYLAWGHPTGNNCTVEEAIGELRRIWESGLPVLCHNAKFDLAVAYERLGLPRLPWDRVHDTMFLSYLCDPHARSLGLKELADDLLAWPPDEQDELNGWIWSHRTQLLAEHGGKLTKRSLGAWIWAAPARLVGEYAVGDVARTMALFGHLWPIVQREGMGAAYDRERQVLPIFMENEEIGMRVDLAQLEEDIEHYRADFDHTEAWLRKKLAASGLNFDADADVAAVLLERGIVPAENWVRTKASKTHPNGQYSVAKDNLLPEHFTEPTIAAALGYRNRLKTCISMFMEPWRDQAVKNGHYITTNWNQVRSAGERGGGTRTGRPSTDKHNFLNLSKSFEGRDDGYTHPDFLGVAPLPLVRKYVLPDEGEVFCHRDFDGQELRVFAHLEQGDLWAQYQDNPALDPHAFVGDELKRVAQREIERTKVKTLNFQGLYGGGIPALQRKLRCSAAEAKMLKQFHDAALPGRKILNEEIKRIVGRGDPIRTWGGRLYHVEPPRMVDGRMRSFEYKLINYAIQGSAADLTKQALIDWHSAKGRHARFLVTVYDEINISAAPEMEQSEMKLLRDVMEAPRLTVPMRSSGKRGLTWGDLTKCA